MGGNWCGSLATLGFGGRLELRLVRDGLDGWAYDVSHSYSSSPSDATSRQADQPCYFSVLLCLDVCPNVRDVRVRLSIANL